MKISSFIHSNKERIECAAPFSIELRYKSFSDYVFNIIVVILSSVGGSPKSHLKIKTKQVYYTVHINGFNDFTHQKTCW